MTDENEPEADELPADEVPADDGNASDKPQTKAEKLEAKAARLREREQARAAAAQRSADTSTGASSLWGFSTKAWAITALVASVLFLASVAVDVPLMTHWHNQSSSRGSDLNDLRDLEVTRQTVLTTANQYAIDFGSYDYRHLDADFAKVASHLTPKFATSYTSVSAQLRASIQKYQGVSTAAVQGVAVEGLTATEATVLVFLDQTVKTSESTTARIDRNRVQMTLQKQPNGSWLISDLLLK